MPNPSILIVEDDAAVREAMAAFLAGAGYEVAEAGDQQGVAPQHLGAGLGGDAVDGDGAPQVAVGVVEPSVEHPEPGEGSGHACRDVEVADTERPLEGGSEVWDLGP